MESCNGAIDRPFSRQAFIRSKCFHPSGHFVEFKKEDIEASIPDRFGQHVVHNPNRLAVATANYRWTYDALNRAANQVAHTILDELGERGEPVALLFEHNAPVIAAILGVLKAGKVYMALDPFSPRARMRYMLADSQARLLVTNNQNDSLAKDLASGVARVINVDAFSDHMPDDSPKLVIPPDALASMYYTSGSTGQPKGVVETHRHRLVNAMRNTNALHICSDDRLALLYASSFSGAVNTTFGALLNGAALFPFDLKANGMRPLGQWLHTNTITIYHSPPQVFRQFVETLEGEALPSLRVILLASDSLYKEDVELYRKYFGDMCLLLNAWGVTESPLFQPYYIDQASTFTEHGVPAVGVSDIEREIVLLDENHNEIGDGQVGEIAIKSRYLSPGYWQRVDLTQAKFRPDPAGGAERLYLTGDLGRMLPDGCLVHLGRKDFQVNIRGYRIELAEIEAALRRLAAVKEGVVIGRPNRHGDQHLVAYVVPASCPPATTSQLRRALAEMLPDYMIPSAFIALDALPLTANGKIDRLALPALSTKRPALDTPFVAPRTRFETQLTHMWREVLGLEQVGIHDPFLELGGDSLMATQILTRVIEAFQVNFPIRALWDSSTVAEMALSIIQHKSNQADPEQISQLLAEVEALTTEDLSEGAIDRDVEPV